MRHEFIEAPEYVGIINATGVLKDEKVQAFIKGVREREGIVAPRDQEELAYNKERHDLLAFFPEALNVASEHLGRAIFEEGPELGIELPKHDGQAEGLVEMAGEAVAALQGPGAGLMQLMMGVFRPYEAVRATARVISRFVVAGYLEPAEPVPSTSVGMVCLSDEEGGPYLLAYLAPWANLDEALPAIKKMHRSYFGGRQRTRVPPKIMETIWLRFCLQDMGREPDNETGYAAAAELSFEVWPATRPKYSEGSPRYEGAVRRAAERTRKRFRQWEKWREPMLEPPEA